jgi:prolyl-tRNA synthetase
MFSKWITSYRDLPLLINQWANVVRWEMRTRLFLRTTEFLWQEGHTVHATREEALEETLQMLRIYEAFGRDFLAIPFIVGEKSESERFPGAVSTFTIEAMMQDRKALQGGTSHFLGQNFSKASNIRFRDAEGNEQFGWTTSWGTTTRLIGAMTMVHSDDDGLVLPPRLAPAHLVILPVIHKEETRSEILQYCRQLGEDLRQIAYAGHALEILIDERDMRGGDKTWSWIKKGIPLRVEIGPRDIASDMLPVFRRDRPHKETQLMRRFELIQTIGVLLDQIQINLYEKAVLFRDMHTLRIDDKESFYQFFTSKNQDDPEIHGGFALTHWNGDPAVEEQIKRDLGVTIRCLPFGEREEGCCPFTGQKSRQRVLFAKAY